MTRENHPPGPPRRPPRHSLCPAAALLLVLIACGSGRPAPDAPDILLVTLDTTRADHLGAYGYHRLTSPVFDALAAESILFERAVVPMATTLPTHLSVLTSTHPLEHGVLANTTQGGERFVPSPTLRSLAAVARDAGYATAAFVSAAPLKRDSGIEVGFDTFDEPTEKQRAGEGTTDAALAWLRRAQRPFFVWVHYYDAHWPFEPQAPYDRFFQTDAALESYMKKRRIADTAPRPLVEAVDDVRQSINAYDGELRYQDAQLGRLLDALRELGVWDRTAVVVVGDHGEGLGQHGLAAHGSTWNEQLQAPLLIRVPGTPPRRVDKLVSALDVVPTLLGLLGVPQLEPALAHASGRDALADGWYPRPVLSQDTGRSRPDTAYRTALTSKRWKYFRTEQPDGTTSEQLYDLGADPFELEDVSEVFPEVRDRMAALLAQEAETRRERGEALRGGDVPRTREADPALLQQLRALGYLEPESEEPGA